MKKQQEMDEIENLELEAAIRMSQQKQATPPKPVVKSKETELREEQDRDYEESLRRDQQIQIDKDNARQKAEEEEEMKQALAMSVSLSKEATLNRLKPAQVPEPSPQEKQPTVTVAVRLPNGAKTQRKFLASQSLTALKAFIDLQIAQQTEEKDFKPDILDKYKLVTSFPKKTITDFSQTFQQADMVPSVLLHVEM